MNVVIGLLLLVITAVMVSLFRSGISLRVATLIKPSEITSVETVAAAVVIRLYPEFLSKNVFILEDKEVEEAWRLLFIESFHKELETTPAGKDFVFSKTATDCPTKCFFENQTEPSETITLEKFEEELKKEQSSVFRLRVWMFHRDEPWNPACETMQRLDLPCLRAVSLRESLRKMKDPTKKYFFLKKYNHNEYFLFIESL